MRRIHSDGRGEFEERKRITDEWGASGIGAIPERASAGVRTAGLTEAVPSWSEGWGAGGVGAMIRARAARKDELARRVA